MDRPIIVLGAPRSGTSMTAGMLHYCGAWVGVCRGANEYNPKGYFENYAIERLRKHNALTLDNVREVLSREGYMGGPWLYKSSPWGANQWEPFNPRFVLVRRDIHKSWRSWCKKRSDLETQGVWDKLVIHNRQLDSLDGITVQADELVYSQAARASLAHEVGLEYTKDADDFVDAALWH